MGRYGADGILDTSGYTKKSVIPIMPRSPASCRAFLTKIWYNGFSDMAVNPLLMNPSGEEFGIIIFPTRQPSEIMLAAELFPTTLSWEAHK